MNEFSICSYNIHKGYCALKLRPILNQLKRAVETTDADLLLLQELAGASDNPQGRQIADQLEFFADCLWPHYAYGKNSAYESGHHGNAILSKQPIQHWHNSDISRWRFSQRGILRVELNNGLQVYCLHLGLLASERQYQLQLLEQLLQQHTHADTPVLIAGDFNDWKLTLDKQIKGRLQLKEAFSNSGKPAKTFPARYPLLAMDRIYYRNLELISSELPDSPLWKQLSDHRPLLARFRF